VAVCGPRGIIELTVRYNGENDGYSFEKNEYVDADAADNDLYFFSKKVADIINSPEKLNGFLRHTRFGLLPYRGSLDEVADWLAENPMRAVREYVPVDAGDWLLVQTPENRHALVEVLSFSGEPGQERKVKLFFAYCTLEGELIF
jgi:hypothetical protein